MKILIISGFLGAGKTTFIKELVKKTKKNIAILENEYGASGIDKDILKGDTTGSDINIWEMTEGCICCSMKNDFAASVLTIANTINPDYLIVEPTGVGMLSGVIRSLQQIEYERISLLAPITIIDGHSYTRYLKEYQELYIDQIVSAHTLIISKMEYASASELLQLKTKLQKLNPTGEIITEHYSSMDSAFWNHLFVRNYDGSFEKNFQEIQELPDTFSLDNVSMEVPELLLLLLERLIHGDFGNIIRAKGTIQAGSQMLQFDVADGKYSVRGIEHVSRKVVFIGTDINRKKIQSYFHRIPRKIPYKKGIRD